MVYDVLLAARQAVADTDKAEQDEVAKYMMQFSNYAYPNDAAQIIILMESIRTIPAEIRMYRRAIRRGRLNAAESLFLTIKYLAVLAWTCNALIENSSYLPTVLACKVVHNIFYYAMFLDVFLVATAIAWRTYVIFQCSRKAYWILTMCLAAHFTMTIFTAHRQHKAGELVGGFCTVLPYDPIPVSHLSVPYFLAFNVLFDASITAASSYRLTSSARNMNGLSRISRVLFNNNVHYAAIVCTVNFAEFVYMVTGDYKRRSLLNISCALQVIACLNLLIIEQDVVHDAAPAYISRNRSMSDNNGSSAKFDKMATSYVSRKSNVDALEQGKMGNGGGGAGGAGEKDSFGDAAQQRGSVIGVNYVVEHHSTRDDGGGEGNVEYGIAKGSGDYRLKTAEHDLQSVKRIKFNSWSASPSSASVLFVDQSANSSPSVGIHHHTHMGDSPSSLLFSPTQVSGANSLTYPIRLPSYEDLRDSQTSTPTGNISVRSSTGLSIKSIRANMAMNKGGGDNVFARQPTLQQAQQPSSRLTILDELPTPTVSHDPMHGSIEERPGRDHSKSSTGTASTFGGRLHGAMVHLPPFFRGSVSMRGGGGNDHTTDMVHTASDASSDCHGPNRDEMSHSNVSGINSPALCHLWQSKRSGAQSESMNNATRAAKTRSYVDTDSSSYLDM